MSNNKITKDSKVYIAGHTGMVGSAIWKNLQLSGYKNIIGKKKDDLNLMNNKLVLNFFKNEKPDIVIDAAAKVGGIFANNNLPYQFLMDNMKIQNNLIEASLKYEVKKFLTNAVICDLK